MEWDYWGDEARAQAAALPVDGALAFMEFMVAACLAPWEVNLRPGEVRDRNMPDVWFADGRGIVTYLIAPRDDLLVVTKVIWFG